MYLSDPKLKFTKRRLESLELLGLTDTEDLLSYYPYRYEVIETKPIAEWNESDKVTFEGEVVSAVRSHHFGRNRTVSNFDVCCQDVILHCSIFNRPWVNRLALNEVLTIHGVVGPKNKITILTYTEKPIAEQDAVTPVYSTRASVQQRTIRDSIRKTFVLLQATLEDRIPFSLMTHYKLLHRRDALRMIHFPQSMEEVKASYRTLKYEEFLEFFIAVKMLKEESGQSLKKQPKVFDRGKIEDVLSRLPFEMTVDQKTAMNCILDDLASEKIMYRLVQGDVGCGKTLVAAIGLYAAVLAGYQAALLAPTEILARQHYESLTSLLKGTPVRIAALYSGMDKKESEQVLEDLANGTIDILVGTHAILQKRVVYAKLGFVVADEQQRFGVEQRRALKEKGNRADFLLMSATPIPRTLASTLYGDMDISTIETMPAGRKPVQTTLIQENSFRSVLEEVRDLLASKHQLYVICAAVEENEDYDARDSQKTAANLAKLFAGEYKVGLLHGRMSSEDKQSIMNSFANNAIQILVSTTVVEVGMNVVNATGMIIYDADRFGMSQLHQLRGRVQRGDAQGKCWLLTDSKDPKTLERLEILARTSNGFEISYEDLRLRGPGDILGTKQSGLPDFILGNLIEDTKMIAQARLDAEEIMNHPEFEEVQAILKHVREKNEQSIRIVD